MDVSYTFTPDQGAIDRLLHSPGGPYGLWFTRLGNRAVAGAQVRANVDTGLMRSRIEFRLETNGAGGTLTGVLAARTNYSYWVHEGARGYSGNPFLTDSLREALGR